MPGPTRVSFATCNLYNLNDPGERIYRDADGWSQAEYDAKLAWLAAQLEAVGADVWGFQELWTEAALVDLFDKAGLSGDYDLVVEPGHAGEIACAAAVRKGLLHGGAQGATWIKDFPAELVLESGGDDDQSPDIKVDLGGFSRPVLRFEIKPRAAGDPIAVYVCHFKSKMPTQIHREGWYRADTAAYSDHREGIGAALSTVRRAAEAAALRVILTKEMKGTDQQVVAMGDFNDAQHSNTLNILTGQPNYLSPLSTGGSDTDLYTVGTLQEYRSMRDVYYTHIYQDLKESLVHILVSQEFYDNSTRRVWALEGMELYNDHLNRDDHKASGTIDHAIVYARFRYKPA